RERAGNGGRVQRRCVRQREWPARCLPHHADGDGGADVLHRRRRVRRGDGDLHPDGHAAGSLDDDHDAAAQHDHHTAPDHDVVVHHHDHHAAPDHDDAVHHHDHHTPPDHAVAPHHHDRHPAPHHDAVHHPPHPHPRPYHHVPAHS